MYYISLVVLNSFSFLTRCSCIPYLMSCRVDVLAATYFKKNQCKQVVEKSLKQRFMGGVFVWVGIELGRTGKLRGPSVSSEREKTILQEIENTAEDSLLNLQDYVKQYASYAPIRNTLLQKSLVHKDVGISRQKRNFIKYLINNIDYTCDPQSVLRWVAQMQGSITSRVPCENADILEIIRSKQIISKAWREILAQGPFAVLNMLSRESGRELIETMPYEAGIALMLYAAFEGENLDDQLNSVVEKFRERIYTQILQSDVNTYIKESLIREIAQEHLTWEQCLSVNMRLNIRDEQSALNKFVMNCIEHKKVDLIEKLLLYVHKWEGNLSYCLASRVFSRLVDFVKIHQHTMPWAVYNAIATSPEAASMVIQQLKNCRPAARIATIFEIIDHCPAIIENSEKLRNYIADFLITLKAEIHTLDPQYYAYLFSSKLGNNICERIIVANDADSLIWFTERFPQMLRCIEECADPHIVSFFEKHRKILLHDTTLFRMAVLRNPCTLEQEIKQLVANDQNATLNFDISNELRLEVYKNIWRVNKKLWHEFLVWIAQTNRLEKVFIDRVLWKQGFESTLKLLNSLPARCRHHSNGLCEYCISMHDYCKGYLISDYSYISAGRRG